jgi:hypothetical protein
MQQHKVSCLHAILDVDLRNSRVHGLYVVVLFMSFPLVVDFLSAVLLLYVVSVCLFILFSLFVG